MLYILDSNYWEFLLDSFNVNFFSCILVIASAIELTSSPANKNNKKNKNINISFTLILNQVQPGITKWLPYHFVVLCISELWSLIPTLHALGLLCLNQCWLILSRHAITDNLLSLPVLQCVQPPHVSATACKVQVYDRTKIAPDNLTLAHRQPTVHPD